MLQRVYDNGYVYKGQYEGWYCPRCADFKTEQEISRGQPLPDPRDRADREQEENYFFKLSAFQERLEQLYADRPEWVRPQNRYNEALSFIKQGPDRRVADARGCAGASRCRGTEPRLLRLVRRAPQLLHGALVRARRART